MPCLSCVAQLHDLCDYPTPLEAQDGFSECCCNTSEGATNIFVGRPSGNMEEDSSDLSEEVWEDFSPEEGRGNLKDVLSTGRHRAAVAKPLEDGMTCEWAGLKAAGGGVKPIVGCNGNRLTKKRGEYARHHGPDKSVLNNEVDDKENLNVHLVCPTCHNRWHVLNDEYYGDGTGNSRPPEGQTWLPSVEWKKHDAVTKATALDIINNEVFWQMNPIDRKEYV